MEQYCPTCKKEYEFWQDDPNAEYYCGYCSKLIYINSEHNYLYCSVKCSEEDEKEMLKV